MARGYSGDRNDELAELSYQLTARFQPIGMLIARKTAASALFGDKVSAKPESFVADLPRRGIDIPGSDLFRLCFSARRPFVFRGRRRLSGVAVAVGGTGSVRLLIVID